MGFFITVWRDEKSIPYTKCREVPPPEHIMTPSKDGVFYYGLEGREVYPVHKVSGSPSSGAHNDPIERWGFLLRSGGTRSLSRTQSVGKSLLRSHVINGHVKSMSVFYFYSLNPQVNSQFTNCRNIYRYSDVTL